MLRGLREQKNAITDWLDLSSIYGSTEKEAEELRDPRQRQFLLVSSGREGRSFLPRCAERAGRSVETCRGCQEDGNRECIFAGDVRANEQPGLTVMHTLWLREHNRCSVRTWSLQESPSP